MRAAAFAFMMAAVLITPSPRAGAPAYELEDLAFPLDVGPGTNVSFVINESMPDRYLFSAGNGPNIQLVFWMSLNGQGSVEYSSISGVRYLDPGAWNFSFETRGRIAVAYNLPQLCGWMSTSLHPNEITCPPIDITEPTAFTPYTWTSETHVVRVQGDVDSYFFDEYLRPLGHVAEMTYKGDMSGVIVVVPRGTAASVVFTVALVPESSTNPSILLVAVIVLAAVVVLVLLLARRRRKREQSRKP